MSTSDIDHGGKAACLASATLTPHPKSGPAGHAISGKLPPNLQEPLPCENDIPQNRLRKPFGRLKRARRSRTSSENLVFTRTRSISEKKKFGGLGTPEIRELRQLREENMKLKKLVADLSLDRQMLQEIVTKIL